MESPTNFRGRVNSPGCSLGASYRSCETTLRISVGYYMIKPYNCLLPECRGNKDGTASIINKSYLNYIVFWVLDIIPAEET
jgi:hypothetical protein